MNKWAYLRSKFSEEQKKIDTYIPSGSAAEKIQTSDWEYYDCMKFLKPFINHRW